MTNAQFPMTYGRKRRERRHWAIVIPGEVGEGLSGGAGYFGDASDTAFAVDEKSFFSPQAAAGRTRSARRVVEYMFWTTKNLSLWLTRPKRLESIQDWAGV